MIDLAAARAYLCTAPISESQVGESWLAGRLLEGLAKAHRGQVAPVATRGALHVYDDETGTWSELSREESLSVVQGFDGAQVERTKINPDGSTNTSARELRLSAAKVKGILECATTHPAALQPRFFEDAPAGVALRNGFATVSAAGIEIRSKSPQNKQLACVDFEYSAEADCPEWVNVLRRVFERDEDAEDKRKLLQEFVGACLVGIAHQYAKCLIFSGSGNNGKNVVVDIIADHLFPEGSVSYTTPQSWVRPEFLSRLRTARVNIANEIPASDIQAGDVFKAVIDGGAVTARDLYANPYTLKPKLGHIFLANDLPGTKDNTNGFWRRVLVLEFRRDFAKDPDETGKLRTKDEVKAAIVAELPGVMLWALHGAVRLMRQGGYTVPASHRRALEEWRKDTDQVAAFLDECCQLDGGEESLTDIHKAFLEWCGVSGRMTTSNRTLAKRLRALGVEDGKDRSGATFRLTVMMRGSWGVRSRVSG